MKKCTTPQGPALHWAEIRKFSETPFSSETPFRGGFQRGVSALKGGFQRNYISLSGVPKGEVTFRKQYSHSLWYAMQESGLIHPMPYPYEAKPISLKPLGPLKPLSEGGFRGGFQSWNPPLSELPFEVSEGGFRGPKRLRERNSSSLGGVVGDWGRICTCHTKVYFS